MLFMKCIWNWMVGEVHIEGTDRHFQSVKYQNLTEKHFAVTPPFPRTEFSIASSMDDLTPLFSDTYLQSYGSFSHSRLPELVFAT